MILSASAFSQAASSPFYQLLASSTSSLLSAALAVLSNHCLPLSLNVVYCSFLTSKCMVSPPQEQVIVA